MPEVLTEVRDRALVVTINRPEARNAVNGATAVLRVHVNDITGA